VGTLLASVGLVTWLWSAPAPVQEKKPEPLAAKLLRPVKFNGADADPKVTLQEQLDALADRYELSFDVNEPAFKAENVEDVQATPITVKAIPKMINVRLETVLRKVLSRIPSASGATYLIRRDTIEITTFAALRAEVWGASYPGPFLPLVHANFDKRPLEEALKQLAEQAEFNIVVDGRAAEEAKSPVSARLDNTPLDTAVRLLANIAGLKTFQVDNVIYVTTAENATQLEEQEKQKANQDMPIGPRLGSGRNFIPMASPAGM
jgi:hypothetical protein